jgi:hypothetical protein
MPASCQFSEKISGVISIYYWSVKARAALAGQELPSINHPASTTHRHSTT